MPKYKLFSRTNEPVVSQACSLTPVLNAAKEQKFFLL